MFKKLLFLSLSLVISFSVPPAFAGNEILQKVAKKYRSAKLVEMNVEKSVKLDVLNKETKYVGKMYIGAGKFRWENSKPEKTLLVFDGATIWSEQSPPAELGGAVQVAKGKIDKKNRSHVLISSLLGADLNKNFTVTKETKQNGMTKLEVKPLYHDLTMKLLNVSIDTKTSELREISYKDEIENLTTLRFSAIKFSNTEKKNLFKYHPPKGAQVTDL